jgi:hypothetical protein
VYELGGVTRREVWSFDAIQRALTGEVYMVNGAESFFPSARSIQTGLEFVSFEIDRFLDRAYTNITYTILQGGVALPGYENVRATSRFVNILDLQPGTAYSIEISFDILSEGGRTETTTATFTTKSS